MSTRPWIVQPRRNTAAGAAENNKVPLVGERVFETDTKRWKTGDGSTPYNDLPYDYAMLDEASESGTTVFTGTPDQGRNAVQALGLVQAAKNPDLLVTGAITLDVDGLVTSAAVVWPDGSPGTLTITSRDSTGAVLAYNITYGSPVTKTFTQPTITRNSSGAATNVPAIVVS